MAKWQCSVCGYQHPGDVPSGKCPACRTREDDAYQQASQPIEEASTLTTGDGAQGDAAASGSIAGYYFHEIDRIPLLSAEDEISLARQMERGRAARRKLEEGVSLVEAERWALASDVAAGEQARRRMIECNCRLVVSVCRKYKGQGVPFLDLVQEGNLGLMRAVERFDYQRGCRFSTYATWWIRQAMERALARHSASLRLPAHVNQQRRRVMRAIDHLRQELGREPMVEEIAEMLGTTPSRVRRTMDTWHAPVSLDDASAGDRADWAGYVENPGSVSPDDVVARSQLLDELKRVMAGLPPVEEQLLQLHFGLADGDTHDLFELATHLGTTRKKVRQIEGRALYKLRYSRASARLHEYAC